MYVCLYVCKYVYNNYCVLMCICIVFTLDSSSPELFQVSSTERGETYY